MKGTWKPDQNLIGMVEEKFGVNWGLGNKEAGDLVGRLLNNPRIGPWVRCQLKPTLANMVPILTEEDRATLKALLGPYGFTLKKVLEVRGGLDE